MVQIKMESGSGFLHEPDEWLTATLDRVEEGDDYGYGPTVKLILQIDGDIDDGGTQHETWAMASQKLSPRSKLYGWIKGIDPNLLPAEGETVNLDDLAGRRVEVMFEHEETPEGTKEKATRMRGSKTPPPKNPAPTPTDLEKPF